MGNVCGSHSTKDGAATAVAEVKAANGTAGKPSVATVAVEPVGNGADVSIRAGHKIAAQETQGSVQSVKGDEPTSISINVAPAPPPDEYPEIKAAVLAAQKEVKSGAKLKFLSKYSLGQVIGTGHYARVQVATCLADGQKYAAKIIKKSEGKEALLLQLQNIVKEVAIMRLLSDHPNTVQLHQVLQDAKSFYLVMEYCNGGEIFDQIIRSGYMSEKVAAEKTGQLLSFLAHSHNKHVIHRDIKPENLLLVRPDGAPDGPDGLVLKVIDFGCSTFCVPGKRLCKKFGTPYYVAPEVLWRDYDLQADVWSAGVVLFILLCGRPPFNGRTDDEIVSRVRTGHYRMCPDDWRHVSLSAQELVKDMLKLDATARPTAEQLLKHHWFADAAEGRLVLADGSELESVADKGMTNVVARLEAFAGMSRMKRLALVVLCHTVTDKHLLRLKEAFAQLDKDGDGHLTPAELHAALRNTGALAKAGMAADIDPHVLEELIAASDLYGEGYVDMDEFLAAMVANSSYSKTKDALRRSFDALDQDHDGFITSADLINLQQQLLGQHHMTKELAEDMMSEVSTCISDTHDGKMDFEEFVHMMVGSDPGSHGKHAYTGRRISTDLAAAEGQQTKPSAPAAATTETTVLPPAAAAAAPAAQAAPAATTVA